MLELITKFTPADGSAPRTITLRISDVRRDSDGATWSVAVDVLGFKHDDSVRLKQVDWAHAIRDAAQFITRMVTDKVELAGGGTLDPPIHPPE
ncbi:MAG: hypothetical protein ABI134_25610 [Byssovorax sp.]